MRGLGSLPRLFFPFIPAALSPLEAQLSPTGLSFFPVHATRHMPECGSAGGGLRVRRSARPELSPVPARSPGPGRSLPRRVRGRGPRCSGGGGPDGTGRQRRVAASVPPLPGERTERGCCLISRGRRVGHVEAFFSFSLQPGIHPSSPPLWLAVTGEKVAALPVASPVPAPSGGTGGLVASFQGRGACGAGGGGEPLGERRAVLSVSERGCR